MNDSILIRQETEKDFGQVEEVVRLAFGNMPESDHTEHILVERLRQSDAYISELSLVAETGDKKIVGHVLLSKVTIVSANGTHTVLSVAPLSVLPEFQRRGIGGMLLREAHQRAAALGYGGVLLLGHEDYPIRCPRRMLHGDGTESKRAERDKRNGALPRCVRPELIRFFSEVHLFPDIGG